MIRSHQFTYQLALLILVTQSSIDAQRPRERLKAKVQTAGQKVRERAKDIRSTVRSKVESVKSGFGGINKKYILDRYAILKTEQDKRVPLALQAPDLKYHEVVLISPHNTYASHFPLSGPLQKQFNYYYAQQGLSIEQLLNIGVRALDLDTYQDTEGMYQKNEVYLTHGGFKTDRLLRAKLRVPPRTLSSVLTSVKQFLEENPYEIITIGLENYVKAPELDKAIRSVNGIEELILKPGEWYPAREDGWPTLGWMVENSKRLLLFNSRGGSQLTFSMWHYFAATTWGSVDVDYLVNNLRNVPKPDQTFYLFSAALGPSAPIPVMKDGTFAEQSRYAITHLNETTDNINFNYTNSTVLSRLIDELKEKYGRMPTMIGIDHVEQGDALSIAYNINKKSIADKAFREEWFGPFPHVRKQP